MSSNNNSESSTSESEISSCSSNFNPRKALYSQKTKIPVADAPMYENVQQYEAALSNKEIIAVGHSDLVKKREEEKERRKKELEQELEEKNKQRFAKYKDLMPTKKEKISRNVLTRMETVRGPLSALKNCVDQRLRIKIGDDFSISDLLRFPLDDNPLSSKAFSSSTPAASSSLTIPLPNSPVTINLPEDSTSLEICDLPLLLNSTLEGKGLLNLDKSIPLNNAARLSLVRIIGTCILRHNPEQIVRSSVYANWARAITSLFLQEKSSVYFHTKIVESTRGIITRLAGKLPDQIHNLKRKYRDSGIVEKRRRTSRSRSSPQSPSLRLPDGLTDEKDAEEKLLWLRNSSEPWTAVEEKWEETTETRLTASKELTIAQYFDEYTALKKPKGYLLVVTRNAAGIRGDLHATLVAFDKQWNLALTDVLEVWKRKAPKKRKVPPGLGVPVPKGTAATISAVPIVTETPLGGGVWECTRHIPQLLVRGEHVVLVNIVDT